MTYQELMIRFAIRLASRVGDIVEIDDDDGGPSEQEVDVHDVWALAGLMATTAPFSLDDDAEDVKLHVSPRWVAGRGRSMHELEEHFGWIKEQSVHMGRVAEEARRKAASAERKRLRAERAAKREEPTQ